MTKTTPRKSRKPVPKQVQEPVSAEQNSIFPVVGIGASAGGLEAVSVLLQNLPEKTGMAYVLIQHLDPTHSSMLREILSRTAKIPVAQVTDKVVIEPDHLYVIPANTNTVIEDGLLRLGERVLTRGQHLPIDRFFYSLASQREEYAIGVVLSGNASDGTAGCTAIKAAGGITFAQDEKTAQYPGMPASAIQAGCIDFVLSPADIARELARIGRHPHLAAPPAPQAEEISSLGTGADMQQLFTLLREARGVDFTHYKQTTLQRRIKRRMLLNRVDNLKDYFAYIKTHPAEVDELYKDILIHVTGFFRDPEAFEALRKGVFPQLFEKRKANEFPVRIWVPGCSTGEEAYSIAIVLLEYMWEHRDVVPGTLPTKEVQIFATDISDIALDTARRGAYAEAALADVSPERLRKFFLRADGGFQINKPIREMCVFAKQNVTKDPPFSNLDLISCRNLLIYLGAVLQKRVIPALHYALKPNAYLMLGGSESLGSFADHFTLLDKKYKIYQKKPSSTRLITYFTTSDLPRRRGEGEARLPRNLPTTSTVEREVQRILSERFIPASIVVNEEMEIVQFHGRTGPYLEPAPGYPTLTLSKMLREGLLVDVRAALSRAKKENAPVRREAITISNGTTRLVNLEVIPVRGQGSSERFYVVVFQDASPPDSSKGKGQKQHKAQERDTRTRETRHLHMEIRQLREQLQSLIEEHEMTSEEFKSVNEELLSANEELQSTNEELETAKEELQSSNEELTTLNEELHNRNAELSQANSDLVNLLGVVNIPVVMVGDDLKVRRFTPPAQKLLNLLPTDVGRRLSEIRSNLETNELDQLVHHTIETATLQEREVREREGGWYLMRMRPYKTWDNKVDGAVISFQDIDAFKRTVDQTRNFADAVIENAREPILILDSDCGVTVANRAFYRTFKVSPGETEGRAIYDLGKGQWNISKLRELLDHLITSNERIDDYELEHDFPKIGVRSMLLNARRIEAQSGRAMILLSIEDITEKRKQPDALRQKAGAADPPGSKQR